MKKILATVLALTMIVGMSIVPTFAAYNGDPASISITANYTKPADAQDTSVVVYDVNVAYDDTVFTYTANGDKLVWNPSALNYTTEVPGEGGNWDHDEATITVTNKSNAAITITAVANNGFDVTESANCASAVGAGEEGANAPTTAELTVTPPESIAATTTVTVTVTIA